MLRRLDSLRVQVSSSPFMNMVWALRVSSTMRTVTVSKRVQSLSQ